MQDNKTIFINKLSDAVSFANKNNVSPMVVVGYLQMVQTDIVNQLIDYSKKEQNDKH